jgi:hypothetical protein
MPSQRVTPNSPIKVWMVSQSLRNISLSKFMMFIMAEDNENENKKLHNNSVRSNVFKFCSGQVRILLYQVRLLPH